MDNISKALDRRYKSFINSEIERDFVVGLAAYIKYIQNTPQLYDIINSLLKDKKKITDKIKKSESKTVNELLEAKKELIKIIKKNYINLKKIDLLNENIIKYIQNNAPLCQMIKSSLEEKREITKNAILKLIKSKNELIKIAELIKVIKKNNYPKIRLNKQKFDWYNLTLKNWNQVVKEMVEFYQFMTTSYPTFKCCTITNS